MKSVSFDEARASFETVFNLAAAGETVVVARDNQRVALHPLTLSSEPEIAPPGYFENDYDPKEIAELNELAAHAPSRPLP